MMDDNDACDNHNIIRPSSSSLTKAPSWSLGVGASDKEEAKYQDCTQSNGVSSAHRYDNDGDNLASSSQTQSNLLSTEIGDQSNARLSLNIPTVYLTKKDPSSSSYHVYQVNICMGPNTEWSIYRRYSQFHALHQQLKAKDPAIGKIQFPPKIRLNSKASTIVQERRRKLEEYMRILSNYVSKLPPSISHQALKSILAGDSHNEAIISGADSLSDSASSDPQTEQTNGHLEQQRGISESSLGLPTGVELLEQERSCQIEEMSDVRTIFNTFISLETKRDEHFDSAQLGG